ncbi:hypothetical protein D049_1470B, partial [Vibrio parahaemolyticus VPTS-2010]
SRNQNA